MRTLTTKLSKASARSGRLEAAAIVDDVHAVPKKGTSNSRRDGPSQHARDHDEVAGVQAQPSVFFDSSGEALDGGNGVAEAKLGFGLSATSRDRERGRGRERRARASREDLVRGGLLISLRQRGSARKQRRGGPVNGAVATVEDDDRGEFCGEPPGFYFSLLLRSFSVLKTVFLFKQCSKLII